MAEVVTALSEAPQGSLLEAAIRAAHAGTLPSAEVIRTLVAGKLAVPSKGDATGAGELRAVVLDKDGKSFVAAFTTAERAEALQNLATHCILMETIPFLEVLESDLGLVINPGTDVVMEISAEGVQRIVQQFGQVTTPN